MVYVLFFLPPSISVRCVFHKKVVFKLLGASDLQGVLLKMQTTEPFLWSFSLRRSGIESENLHFYLIFSDAAATGPGTRLRSTDTGLQWVRL